MSTVIEVETTRLRMRGWRDADRAEFAALNADPRVMRFFPSALSREQSDAMVDRIEARFAAHGYGLWALEVIETGSFIGFTGLGPMPAGVPGTDGIEIGWRLAHAAWGHGYATEAGRAALRVAFETLELEDVWSLTAAINVPSRAVMERLGLAHVDTQNHPGLENGDRLNPHVFYRITEQAWRDGRQITDRARPRLPSTC